MEQVAQTSCGVTVLAGIQHRLGRGLAQPALGDGDPALSRGSD